MPPDRGAADAAHPPAAGHTGVGDPAGAPTGEPLRPAYYAAPRSTLGDWWTLLHPPYTAWHLGYVVIGACLAPHVHLGRLVATVVAFFLAVGLGAHALDELHGRPLRTGIPSPVLTVVAAVSLAGALGIGVVGVLQVGWTLIPFLVAGPMLVVAYNAELLGGVVHTDLGFALAWGAFPVLTAYVAQEQSLSPAAAVAGAAAVALSLAQRALSTPARQLRRRVTSVAGSMTMVGGGTTPLSRRLVLAPLELALRAMSWAVVLLAAALALARLG